MATDRQIAANRRNGALSRGPKTAAGKARSSRNALKHGLAIPISRDRATARKIRRAAQQMAPSAVGDSIRNAQIAADLCHRIRNQLHRRRIADRARHTDWNSDAMMAKGSRSRRRGHSVAGRSR
jgi:hypothetical protein